VLLIITLFGNSAVFSVSTLTWVIRYIY